MSDKLTDHDKIKDWVTKNDGFPATVKDTQEINATGILRIGFNKQDALMKISWNEFFQKFDEEKLALVVAETSKDKDGFCKIVSR